MTTLLVFLILLALCSPELGFVVLLFGIAYLLTH